MSATKIISTPLSAIAVKKKTASKFTQIYYSLCRALVQGLLVVTRALTIIVHLLLRYRHTPC